MFNLKFLQDRKFFLMENKRIYEENENILVHRLSLLSIRVIFLHDEEKLLISTQSYKFNSG